MVGTRRHTDGAFRQTFERRAQHDCSDERGSRAYVHRASVRAVVERRVVDRPITTEKNAEQGV
jgi:hypothetical protein